MRMAPALCIGGYEIANGNRVMAYGARELFNPDCLCPALDGLFLSPAEDPAPWYDEGQPQSGDFLGFLPSSITSPTPASRPSSDALDEGSVIGAQQLPGRVVEVQGWMIARDAHSMWWGERWLTEALRGSMCKTGCSGDELNLLPFCRESDESGDPYAQDFRNLVGAALVDGPRFSELLDDGCYLITTAQFQFMSQMPWLYQPGIEQVADEPIYSLDTACTLVTTDTWMDGEAMSIRIDAPDGAGDLGLVLSFTASLDGTCPEDRVAPWFTVQVTSMEPESYLIIDATRRRAVYYDPTAKREVPAFDRMRWYRGANPVHLGGGFCWPILSACTSACFCIQNLAAQDVTWSLTRYPREL